MATPIWDEKEKRWTLRVTVDGTRKKFTSVKPGNAGKRAVLSKARQYLENGAVENPTVAQEWSKYLEDVLARSSPENYRNIELMGRLYILPSCSNKKLEKLTLVDWQQIINKSKKKNGEPLSKKSYSNIRGTITNFLNFCYRDRVIDYQPFGLYVPKNAEVVGKEILQPEQIKALFDSEAPFKDEWYLYYYQTLLITGARPGEIIGLKWTDIEDRICHIRRSINVRGRITPGKNKNAQRSFILPEKAIDILAKQKVKTAHLKSEWIFPNEVGGQPVQGTALKHWNKIAEVIGSNACLYSFRHTFISIMKSSTLPEQLIKDLVGHSASMDTWRTYGHVVNGEQEQTAIEINKQISKII